MFFGRQRTVHLDDRVWATAHQKFEGICREIVQDEVPGRLAVTAAHEPRTFELLKERFAGSRIRFVLWETLPPVSDFDFNRHVGEGTQAILVPSTLAAEARRIVPLLTLGRLFSDSDESSPTLRFIVAERSLLPAPDRDLAAFAESLPWRSEVRFHVSLEDALLTAAVPDRITALMRSLGWDGRGPFSHPSVTGMIGMAQRFQRTRVSAQKRSAALIDAGRRPRRGATP
jgi:hypothetical protein